MKLAPLPIAVLSLAAFYFTGCATTPGSNQPKWTHVTQFPNAKPPRGKVVTTDNGSVLTLPDGKKFVSKTNGEKTKLWFPNRQTFSAETAKGGFQPPYVSVDNSLVASLVIPATQSGDLHLFVVGPNAKYREIPSVNDKIGKILTQAGAPFGATALRLLDLKGHTLSLGSPDYGAHRGEGDLFSVQVARDGSLSLR